MTVIFATLIGSFSLGQAAPHFSFVTRAMASAYIVFDILAQKPTVNNDGDGSNKELRSADNCMGDLTVSKVRFAYPTKPDLYVLNDFQLEIPRGKTVALVGSSGCGKSTVTNLLLRFYDP